jgi:hypothetical protein
MVHFMASHFFEHIQLGSEPLKLKRLSMVGWKGIKKPKMPRRVGFPAIFSQVRRYAVWYEVRNQ